MQNFTSFPNPDSDLSKGLQNQSYLSLKETHRCKTARKFLLFFSLTFLRLTIWLQVTPIFLIILYIMQNFTSFLNLGSDLSQDF